MTLSSSATLLRTAGDVVERARLARLGALGYDAADLATPALCARLGAEPHPPRRLLLVHGLAHVGGSRIMSVCW